MTRLSKEQAKYPDIEVDGDLVEDRLKDERLMEGEP